jgi:hypothetical protein
MRLCGPRDWDRVVVNPQVAPEVFVLVHESYGGGQPTRAGNCGPLMEISCVTPWVQSTPFLHVILVLLIFDAVNASRTRLATPKTLGPIGRTELQLSRVFRKIRRRRIRVRRLLDGL